MLNIQTATVSIVGIGPLSQSRQHTEPKLDGETHDDYDRRTWRSKLNVTPHGTVCIPAHGMHQCLIAAAKFSGKQIPGQGKKTWTAKFQSGLMIPDAIDTGIDAATVPPIVLSVSARGIRGVGGRVTRWFPMVPEWRATFDLLILDPIITEPVLAEMIGIAGMFIGVGRFRPEVGGSNGRFSLDSLSIAGPRKRAA